MALPRRKYGNKKVRLDTGEVFDSRKEYCRYLELVRMVQEGAITDLQRQVTFPLIPSQRVGGRVVERPCTYKADFVYQQDGQTVVEDAKGMRTPEYRIKRKLMLWIHHVQIKES